MREIYINGRFLTQSLTGVNRYAYELCKALNKANVKFVIICPNDLLKESYDITDFQIIKFGFGFSHFWEQLCLPLFFLFKSNYVLINFSGLGPIFILNKIITIHDLAYLENPSWYSKIYYVIYKLLTPLSAMTSTKVLTVSSFSKNEIVKKIKIDPRKIVVVFNAVSELMRIHPSNNRNNRDVEEQYILAVSSVDPRKNFATLIKCFSLLNNLDLKLYIIGDSNRVFSTNNLGRLNYEKIHFLGRVSDDELKHYYTNALAFIYPSLYEGFGLPPIEAMAMGCPTIVSDISVLHEVCGDASLYVNPLDFREIALKITLLYDDISLRNELINKGYQQFQKYDWNRSAKRIISIIEGND